MSTEFPTSLFSLGEGGRNVFLGTQPKKTASLVRPTSQEQNTGSVSDGFDRLGTYRFFTPLEFRVKGEMGEPGDSMKIVATSSWSYSEKQPSVTSGSEQVSCRGGPSRESLD